MSGMLQVTEDLVDHHGSISPPRNEEYGEGAYEQRGVTNTNSQG